MLLESSTCRILKVLPFLSSTMLSLASLDIPMLVRHRTYWSRGIAGQLPAS